MLRNEFYPINNRKFLKDLSKTGYAILNRPLLKVAPT